MKKYIGLIILFFMLVFFIKYFSSDSKNNLNKIESQFSEQIGINDTKKLFCELQEMSEFTKETVIEKCEEYGICLSEIQLNEIMKNIKNWGENSGFFETIEQYSLKFWKWIKNLGKDSTIEIDSNPDKNQPIISKDKSTVTITLPKTKDVDNLVDSLIDKIKNYITEKE